LWLLRGFASVPRFFTLPVTTSLYVSRSHQNVAPDDADAFSDDRWIVTAEQTIRRGRAINLSWGYRFERNHVFDPEIDPDDFFPLDFSVDTARLTSAFAFDTRDDPFSPRRGWFSGTTLEYAVPSLGSDLDFVKVLTQGYYFHGLGPVVLASAVRLGGLFGRDSLFSERFFTGGGTTVRGYKEESLGPEFFGEPDGGDGLLVLNQEARVHVWKWIGAVGFVDAGNAFAEPSEISLKDLKVGIGAGLRLDTPFVLLRLDYGIPVPRPEGSPFGRWYFSLGHVF
jgi:outer membrane protein insertion porin family